MAECPVCVYHAANVSQETLRGFRCCNCGRDLGDHPFKQKNSVPPSMAFAIDASRIGRWHQNDR